MLLGILLSISSAIFIASGICMQKIYAKRKREGIISSPAFKDLTYLNGIVYVGIGLVMKIPIFIIVPQTSIAALSAQNFLYTSALDYLVLATKMTKLTLWSAVAVTFGLILTLVEDDNSEDVSYSIEDIIQLFFSNRSVILTISTIAFMICMMELFRVSQFETSSNLRLFYISSVAGLFAAWFGTVLKATFEVLYYDYSSPNNLTFRSSWLLLLIVAVILGFYKMKFTSSALKEFNSFRFLPLYQSFAVILNAVCGIVYFDEKRYTSKYYIVGLLFICGGICSLLLQPHTGKESGRGYINHEDGDDRERQSLLSSPTPTAGDGRHDDAHTLSSSGPEEVQFSDYPFLNSIAGWLMDLLRYDKSEVHIDYSEYLEESDQTFSTNSPIRHGHSHGKGTDKDKFAAQGGLPDEGAFHALSKQSSPNRGNSSSSSSPLFVGSLDVKTSPGKKGVPSTGGNFAIL